MPLREDGRVEKMGTGAVWFEGLERGEKARWCWRVTWWLSKLWDFQWVDFLPEGRVSASPIRVRKAPIGSG